MSGRALAAFGGLSGAAGVTLLAMGAHHSAGAPLTTAGQMLLFHAPFLFVMGSSGQSARLAPFGRIALGILVVGLIFFCGDLVLRALLGVRLLAYLAPIGGSMLILGWIGLGIFVWFARSAGR